MLAILLGCALQQAKAEDDGQALKASESKVYALIYKTGAASSMAHDHVVKATEVTGALSFDPAVPESLSIQVSVPVHGLSPDEDAMRDLVGLPDKLSSEHRKEVKLHIRSDDQLGSAGHSVISFSSRSVVMDDKIFQVTGDFSLRGVSKSITVPMKVAVTDSGGGPGEGPLLHQAVRLRLPALLLPDGGPGGEGRGPDRGGPELLR